MVGRTESVALDDVVQLPEVALVETHHCFCFLDAFVLLNVRTWRERPQEARQAVDVAALLQYLANTGHLVLGEAEFHTVHGRDGEGAGAGREGESGCPRAVR